MMMLSSEKYSDVYPLVSKIRRKYGGYASQETRNRIQDSTWILNNMNYFSEADIALLAEYNRNIREEIVTRLRQIIINEK